MTACASARSATHGAMIAIWRADHTARCAPEINRVQTATTTRASAARPNPPRALAERMNARKKPYVSRWLAQLGRFRDALIIRGSQQVTSSAPTATPFGLPVALGDQTNIGSRIEPVLDDESANSAVFQCRVVGHQRSLVLDRGTRDHQIKVTRMSGTVSPCALLSGSPHER